MVYVSFKLGSTREAHGNACQYSDVLDYIL